jgi:hypothetical protein
LGDTAGIKVTYLYNASGNLTTSGNTAFAPTYLIATSGKLALESTITANLRLAHEATGNLNIGSSSHLYVFYDYRGSGTLILGSEAVLAQYTAIGSGGISIGSSAVLVICYIYNASGSLNRSGVSEYWHAIKTAASEPFSVERYWLSIEERIRKQLQERSGCNDPTTTTAFLALLDNDQVKARINASGTWKLVCYLGGGLFDIEIDGMRMVVDVMQSSYITTLIPPTVNVNIAPPPRKDEAPRIETFLPKDVVLAGLTTRMKSALASVQWTAKYGMNGEIILTINEQTQFIVELHTEEEPVTSIPEPTVETVVNTNSSFVPQYDIMPKEVVLARTANNSRIKKMLTAPDVKDWYAEMIEGGLISITITSKTDQVIKIAVNLFEQVEDNMGNAPTAIATRILPASAGTGETIYTFSQDRVLSMMGTNSFLSTLPKSDWKVLKVHGTQVDVQLNNGLVFSVPL